MVKLISAVFFVSFNLPGVLIPFAVGTVCDVVSLLILANLNEYINSSECTVMAEWFLIFCFYTYRRLR